MSRTPYLSQRRICAYNRLQVDVIAMTYIVRFHKPKGPIGEHTREACNSMIQQAFKLFRREAGMPHFRVLIPDEPFTLADLAILVTRLTAAGIMFEDRYAHYKANGKFHKSFRVLAPALDADGFPSKHT
ncbi:hypothetical protein DevBK_02445 [Devosia sp. BK]|jgi:hypothetical protein|uniref:hypothetical protein n=1 Tax=unclassified Devosia TaxID=196773 RepID=UPI000716271E|nr:MULTISPECIES: hypothetical protein [unclassified Devosia]KQN69937.1 hypothetical protein ASE94_12660 [Devosia sp. Leaf64]KQT46058.1 hypothetical protein ASG47_14065 [Devosia sp. Leaf420]MDV3250186.1 hypothetical protein [Devosia sp. BK]